MKLYLMTISYNDTLRTEIYKSFDDARARMVEMLQNYKSVYKPDNYLIWSSDYYVKVFYEDREMLAFYAQIQQSELNESFFRK